MIIIIISGLKIIIIVIVTIMEDMSI